MFLEGKDVQINLIPEQNQFSIQDTKGGCRLLEKVLDEIGLG